LETLLDGELLKTKQGKYHFLVFDAIFVDGKFLQRSLLKRLKEADKVLGSESSLQLFFPLSDLKKVMQDITPAISQKWETDGLVFTPNSMPYKFGFNKRQMKWKPGEKKTADFALKHVNGKWQLFVQAKDKLKFFGYIDQNPEFGDGKIIECCWQQNPNDNGGKWTFARVRSDKSTPNADWVVSAIVESLNDSLETIEDFEALNEAN
jgi:hypothetical protein